MNLALDRKVALVSGSSRGIGRAIAQALLAEGCRVVLNGRDEATLAATQRELKGETQTFAGDVSEAATAAKAVAFALKSFGSLDILVCNVGNGTSKVNLGAETEADWLEALKVNLMSATQLVHASTAALADSKGSILCVSSICGLAALGAPIAYSAAKAALNSFVQGMARPLGAKGIRINAVAPGNILFPGSTWERKLGENSAAVTEMLKREVALNRLGSPQEIADFAAFLVSPRAAFSTGALFVIDGGQLKSH